MWHFDNLILAFYLLALLTMLGIAGALTALYTWYADRDAIRVRAKDTVCFMRDFKA